MTVEQLVAALRPRSIWANRHTGEATEITRFSSRVERVPDAAGGFRDEPQLVVHHTVNVPPHCEDGYGEDLEEFIKHWVPR